MFSIMCEYVYVNIICIKYKKRRNYSVARRKKL